MLCQRRQSALSVLRYSHVDVDLMRRLRSMATCSEGEETDRLVQRVQQALSGTPAYTASHERMRVFWHNNWKTYRNVQKGKEETASRWSHFSMARSAVSRDMPIQNALRHGVFSSMVTLPFIIHNHHREADVHDVVATYIADPSLAHFFVTMCHTVDAGIEHLVANQDLLQGVTGFLASAVFLMLSFRLNRAYMRWLQGGEVFHQFLTSTRNLTLTAQLSINKRSTAVDVSLLAYAHSRALEQHLRRQKDEGYADVFGRLFSEAELATFLASHRRDRPLHVAQALTWRLSEAYDAGEVKNVRLLVSLMAEVQSSMRLAQELHRIQSMAEPFAYMKHLELSCQLWLGMLPLALVPTLLFATPVLSTAIAYVVYKLEDVAVELTNPFGYDASDHHICTLNDQLQVQLRGLLLRYARGSPVAVDLAPPEDAAWKVWGGRPPKD